MCLSGGGVASVLPAALALHVEQQAVAMVVSVAVLVLVVMPRRISRIVKSALWLANCFVLHPILIPSPSDAVTGDRRDPDKISLPQQIFRRPSMTNHPSNPWESSL